MNMTAETTVEAESDENLFIYIACRETAEDEVLANLAFAEIHRRYAKPLYRKCVNFCRSFSDGNTLAEELTSATLTRAYERADQYRPSPLSESTNADKRTLAWLCTIARNLLLDLNRNPKRPGPLNITDLDVDISCYSSDDFAAFFNDLEQPLNNSHEHNLVAEAFETLDNRTQEVLITTLIQRDRSPKKTHMLRGTVPLLADRLNTTPDNIRRIRLNGIRVINDYLKKYNQN